MPHRWEKSVISVILQQKEQISQYISTNIMYIFNFSWTHSQPKHKCIGKMLQSHIIYPVDYGKEHKRTENLEKWCGKDQENKSFDWLRKHLEI